MSERLVVLLPVRNGAGVLDEWFAAVEPYADAVVALDDGSTDDTREILREHRLTTTLLTHPVREGFDGWDDYANRTELLAASTEGDWVLFLDGDERIPAADAADLRRFVDEGAEPGFAYGFSIHRATDDLERYEATGRWVYRMFAAAPGQTLPAKRLHFVPIPESIPRRRWLRTSLRLLHVATTSPRDGVERVAKYLAADPTHAWQDSYDHLAVPPEVLEPVPERRGPVVLPIHERPADDRHPVVSVIVISRDDETRIERCVRSVMDQVVDEPFEVIVVNSGSDSTADVVRSAFPTVTVVALDQPALPGAARNAGLAVARGDIIAFPSSHVELPAGALQARLDAHRRGWAMVTGPVLNGNPTRAGWATYFLDHSSLLPDRPAGEMETAPTRCSYVRFLLDRVGGFPEGLRAGEDTAVNLELWRQGFSAYRSDAAAAIHTSLIGDAPTLFRRHRERGVAWARLLLARYGSRRRVVLLRGTHLIMYVPARLWRIRRNVRAWGDGLRAPYRRARPLIVLGALAAWLGVISGLIAGQEGPTLEPPDS